MAKLFRNQEGFEGGKYLVQRRDGTVPQWPWFVIGAADPAAPAALFAYAEAAEQWRMDPEYVADIRKLAEEFKAWHRENGLGDPDGPRHRTDDPEIIAKMRTAHKLS